MKNFLTGAAQSVTDTNERVRKIFENRPLEAPMQPERKNFNSRRKPSVAAAEDEAPLERDTAEGEVAEMDGTENDEKDE